MNSTFAILGPGAIGGLLATLLCRAGHDVVCIGNEKSVSRIKKNGIRLESTVFGGFSAYPSAELSLKSAVDVVFITIKAPYLEGALSKIKEGVSANTVVIPLLNGVGHQEIIRQFIGNKVAVGMIGSVEAVKDNEIVRHFSRGYPHIDLASDNDVSPSNLMRIADKLRSIGITVDVRSSESEVIWNKLVRLNAIASMTAAYQLPVGYIREDKCMREILIGIIKEGCLVAKKDGVNISEDDVIAQVDSLPSSLKTSLQNDVALGLCSEIESITGGVLRMAGEYNVSTPALQQVYEMILDRIKISDESK